MLSGHSAIIWLIRSAVAGALPCFAEPMVRRMPRRTAFTASLPVGGSWPELAPRCAAHADTGRPLLDLQGHAMVVVR